METDKALQLLGSYSRWQIRTYLVFGFGFGVMGAWVATSVVFMSDDVDHRCKLPPNATLNESIPMEYRKGEWKYAQCTMYDDNATYGYTTNHTVPCKYGYVYDPNSGYESTLVTEFDLVCGKNYLIELVMSLSSIGSIIGAFVYSRLSDKIGRKPAFLICVWSQIFIGIGRALGPSYVSYALFTFLSGLQLQGAFTISVVLALEIFPTEQRTFAGMCIQFFWVLGLVTTTAFAYFIRDWRKLVWATTLPQILTLIYAWYIYESIPWLVVNGKYAKAEKILRNAAEVSKVTLPDGPIFGVRDSGNIQHPDVVADNTHEDQQWISENSDTAHTDDAELTLLENTDAEDLLEDHSVKVVGDTNYGVKDALKSRPLRKYWIILLYIWFVNGLVYGAVGLTVTFLKGDRYVNFLLYGLIEIPAYGITWIALHKVGRVIPIAVFHFIAGVALMATTVQYFDSHNTLGPLIIALSLIGKFGISASFGGICLNTPEIFPTKIRNTGSGSCTLFARIGGFLAPYARVLVRSHPYVLEFIVGGLAILAGILTLVLPETRHTDLPDTITEVEGWSRKTTPRFRGREVGNPYEEVTFVDQEDDNDDNHDRH